MWNYGEDEQQNLVMGQIQGERGMVGREKSRILENPHPGQSHGREEERQEKQSKNKKSH